VLAAKLGGCDTAFNLLLNEWQPDGLAATGAGFHVTTPVVNNRCQFMDAILDG
jgi:hypothetical protein